MADEVKGGPKPARPVLADVTVEIVSRKNNQYVFYPASRALRGRWDGHNLAQGDQSEAGLFKMPVIPGTMVTVSHRQKRGVIHDPLSEPDNRTLMREVNGVHKAVLKDEVTFFPDEVTEDMSEDQLATWYYWLMRGVKMGMARIVSGNLPGSEESLMTLFPGATITKRFYDSASQAMREEAEMTLQATS